VIDVTGLLWITPSFFGQRVIPTFHPKNDNGSLAMRVT
jgi:hypothetical protein